MQIWTVAPAIGLPVLASVTVPVILPQVPGGFTCMVTPTGETWYGVFVLTSSCAA